MWLRRKTTWRHVSVVFVLGDVGTRFLWHSVTAEDSFNLRNGVGLPFAVRMSRCWAADSGMFLCVVPAHFIWVVMSRRERESERERECV